MGKALRIAGISIALAIWAAVVWGGLVIVWNSASYLTQGLEHPFIVEKRPASESWLWLGMLWIHIAGGVVAMLTAMLQFFRPLMKRLPAFHRSCGLAYTYSLLAVTGPTGIYLALYAKFGFWSSVGFALNALLTMWFTAAGWYAIRRGKMTAHRDWMIRSYAMVMTAATFRALHMIFFYAGLSYEANYLGSLWGSIAVNQAVAEIMILCFGLADRSRRQNQQKKTAGSSPDKPQPTRRPTYETPELATLRTH